MRPCASSLRGGADGSASGLLNSTSTEAMASEAGAKIRSRRREPLPVRPGAYSSAPALLSIGSPLAVLKLPLKTAPGGADYPHCEELSLGATPAQVSPLLSLSRKMPLEANAAPRPRLSPQTPCTQPRGGGSGTIRCPGSGDAAPTEARAGIEAASGGPLAAPLLMVLSRCITPSPDRAGLRSQMGGPFWGRLAIARSKRPWAGPCEVANA
jgi:hypothetical protein